VRSTARPGVPGGAVDHQPAPHLHHAFDQGDVCRKVGGLLLVWTFGFPVETPAQSRPAEAWLEVNRSSGSKFLAFGSLLAQRGARRQGGAMVSRLIQRFAVGPVVGLLACSTGTVFKNTWKDPDAAPLSVKKGDLVIAMVMSKEETTRRSGEDFLSDELRARGMRPIPSFTLIPTDQVDNREKATAAIKESGAVAVFVLRPIAVTNEQTYMPPTYMGGGPYGGFGPYYGYGWGAADSPGYVVSNTVVRVESLVFDLRQDKLIWGGQSETTNPERLDLFIKDVVKGASEDMVRRGVIAPPPS